MSNSNVQSFNTATVKPMQRFKERLNKLQELYHVTPSLDVVTTFIHNAEETFSVEGMCILDGNVRSDNGKVITTFICHEGALFPTPVPGVPFMTLEQTFEYPYDYNVIKNQSAYDDLAEDYRNWYCKFNAGDSSSDGVAGLSLLGMLLWKTLIQLDYGYIESGEMVRPGETTFDNSNYFFVLQQLDVKFVITIDLYALAEYFALLHHHARVQNHTFL